MNYLDGYVKEVLSEPYYDDYGSGVFRWWVKVSYREDIIECLENTFLLTGYKSISLKRLKDICFIPKQFKRFFKD